MLEVEGGTQKDCLRIMRHEAGHAIDNAFLLHRRRRYPELFGQFSRPYPNWYKPEPNSRQYVLHLPGLVRAVASRRRFCGDVRCLAAPGSAMEKAYAGWPALRKLEYVDEVMRELAGKGATSITRRKRLNSYPGLR